jgi:hypothetical protein
MAMTEHVHEWKARLKGWLVDGFYCTHPDCYRRLIWNDVESRLNATERLSAEQAGRAWALIVTRDEVIKFGPLTDEARAIKSGLKAYADTLEGK